MSLDPVSVPELTTPERQLWAAVLLRAIKDIAGLNTYLPPVVRTCVQRSAKTWIESPVCGPGSFLWICDRLGLDAEAVRRQVLKAPSRALVARIKAIGGRGGDQGKSPLFDTP